MPDSLQRSEKKLAAVERATAEHRLLVTRLLNEGSPHLSKLIADCGKDMKLTCTNCGHLKVVEETCRKRWCPRCASTIAAQRNAKYALVAQAFQWPLFVTLTMRNSPDPDSLVACKRAWTRLRRRKLIRERVKGGIVGWEVTNQGRGWHPHLHAILDCEWLALHVPPIRSSDSAETKKEKAQAAACELECLWASILGQSSASVRVRRANAGALREVLKYSVKGSQLLASPGRITELIETMQGMRLLTTFGSAFNNDLADDPDEDPAARAVCDVCQASGSFMPDFLVGILMRS